MSRISVRGFAVASATAVTTVGAVVGVAAGQPASVNAEATAADATIADIPAGAQAQVQTASLTQQADDASTQADAASLKSAQEAARKAAAETAQSKKDAADEAKAKKEADARKKKELAASRSAERDVSDLLGKSSYTIAETQSLARGMMAGDQFQCFSNIVDHESGWNYRATNASSGAYGLVQALPGSKMSSAGSDWQTNPATQIKWGLNYMNDRYGSPCGAWSFWQANSWY
ncbi:MULTISPECIES: transglycosylase SLT domain-containing protein [unclassified Streptomyces]|uniref:aggregation-promoting factor C-terminal-like domain-containing protein n=1 Tax=unclassified Streptomyces TaxID=2593676 RepID=UPI00382C4F39